MTKLLVTDRTDGKQSCIDVDSWDFGVSLVGQDVLQSEESLWGTWGLELGLERGSPFPIPRGSHCHGIGAATVLWKHPVGTKFAIGEHKGFFPREDDT